MRSNTVSRFVSASLFLIISGNVSTAADDAYRLARLGGQRTLAEKTSLEQNIAENPSDVESRIKQPPQN